MTTFERPNGIESRTGSVDRTGVIPPLEKITTIRRGEPMTWGPTPLNPFYDKVLLQQSKVQDTLHALTTEDVPESTPDHIASYVSGVFLSRFHGRSMANYDNYMTALSIDRLEYANDPSVQDIFDRSLKGQASPAELLYVRSQGALRSVELGCVSHPYGKHIEHLYTMRDVVNESAAMFGGRPVDGEKFSVKSFDVTIEGLHSGVSLGDAFMMTRKRDIAVLPDDTHIRERSSFIVRTDPLSHFDQRLSAAMHRVPIHGNDSWAQQVCQAGHLEEVIPAFLESDDYLTAIPLSTTVYAYNGAVEERIKHDQRANRSSLLEQHKDEYPEIARVLAMSRAHLGAKATDSMVYIGPDISKL